MTTHALRGRTRYPGQVDRKEIYTTPFYYVVAISTDLSVVGSLQFLIDGLTTVNNFYFNSQAAVNKHITFTFTGKKIITEVTYYQELTTSHGVFQFQGSNDGITWTNIGSSFTLGGAATQVITTMSGNSIGYSAYRLYGVSGNMSNASWVYEFALKIRHLME